MYWLGTVLVFALMLYISKWFDPGLFSLDETTKGVPMVAAEAIAEVVLMIIGMAVSVKRFNDGNWPWWTGYLIGLIGVASTGLEYFFGFLSDVENLTSWEWVALAVLIAMTLFELIVNGFIRGTRGPNRYGPDPLGATEAAKQRESGGDWAD